MISILSALFIRDRANFTDPDVRQKYGMLCGAAGIALNLILFAGKFLAGILSHSIAVTADAVNNLSDAGSSVITLIGFKLAGQAPDPDHPFGHGRIEYVSGLIVSCLIILMGVELLKSSVDKILHPAPVEGSALVLAILAASIAVKITCTVITAVSGRNRLGGHEGDGHGQPQRLRGHAGRYSGGHTGGPFYEFDDRRLVRHPGGGPLSSIPESAPPKRPSAPCWASRRMRICAQRGADGAGASGGVGCA